MNVPLERDKTAESWVCSVYEKLGRVMARCNFRQADLPKGAEALHNPKGTAPGFVIHGGQRTVAVFPGVPSEFRAMVDRHLDAILERLKIPVHHRNESCLLYTSPSPRD